METYGLLGYPLGATLSKRYFEAKFEKERIEAQFLNFEMAQLHDLEALLQSTENLRGLAVTIPHKETILPLLDSLDEDAAKIGAVNSVKIYEENGLRKTKGYNTDVYGFQKSLVDFIPKEVESALVLGTGGASKAVRYVLEKLKIDFKLVSRNAKAGQLTYEDLTPERVKNVQLIVNTTPLGTFPKVESCPHLPYEALSAQHYLFDLVYNPAETLFLKRGKARGASVQNGMRMLELQAERSWAIWTS